ncbi:MAG: enoyl-ACP reductase FabV [Treponemataceae bacterium]
MIIKPMIRNSICLNAHPVGCRESVAQQIAYVQNKISERKSNNSLKNVLVLGCSNGYGLASRITAAFGYGAATVGVSFEKEGSESKGGTPGWYNNLAFDAAAKKTNLFALSINGDAFSNEIKNQVVEVAKKNNITFDLVVYSLASPVRQDPNDGVLYKSVLKPLKKSFSGITVDPFTGTLKEVTAEQASDEEVAHTIKVMGGEDWELWIDCLQKNEVLKNDCITVAYSYIGPVLSHAIYRDGTIGKAKEHLEKTAALIEKKMAPLKGRAFVSVNKGLVTRASAVIPIIPLYLSVLFKVMKKQGTHEGCIEQIERLFAERLYTSEIIPVDNENRIRIDDWEMDEKVQSEVNSIMEKITQDNVSDYADLAGYQHDFLAANGFDISGVDYDIDIPRLDRI